MYGCSINHPPSSELFFSAKKDSRLLELELMDRGRSIRSSDPSLVHTCTKDAMNGNKTHDVFSRVFVCSSRKLTGGGGGGVVGLGQGAPGGVPEEDG